MLHLTNLIDTDREMYQYMGLLFLRLGFKTKDKILLCNYDVKDSSFDCIVNNAECYRIKFNRESNEILVSMNNFVYGYQCESSSVSEIGMKVSLGSYTCQYSEGILFKRCFSRDKVKIVVNFYDYVLELEILKPDDIDLPLYDEKGRDNKYKLHKEKALKEYLSSFSYFGESIIDIYKKICDICIEDVSVYPKFSLKIYKLVDDKMKVMGLINLKYGVLEEFGLTKGNISVFTDKDDNWSYDVVAEETLPVNFSMHSKNGKISCEFSAMEDYDLEHEYIPVSIGNDIKTADREVIAIRRKVKKMFDKNNNQGSN